MNPFVSCPSTNLGETVVGRIEAAAAEYDTLLGRPAGSTGDIRFIFQLDGATLPNE